MILERKRLTPLILCLLLTLFSLVLHTLPQVNTMINYVKEGEPKQTGLKISDRFLSYAVNYHKTLPDFQKRQVTTTIIEWVANVFNLRIAVSFVWVNFSFIFFCGLLVYYLGQLYALTHSQSLWSIVFFYCSFSVLLAYFIPIATYDESIQYFFILLSLIALNKDKKILFVVAFTLATLTRESSLILLPGIAFFLLNIDFKNAIQKKLKTVFKIIPVALPVVFYILYLLWFYKENPETYEQTKVVMAAKSSVYLKNFGSVKNLSRTILFFISVYLLPMFFLLFYKKQHFFSPFESKLIRAFVITFCINTPFILAFGYAEECRVFTLPLLFLFPVFGKIVRELLPFSLSFFAYLIHPKRLGFLIGSAVMGWIFFDYYSIINQYV